MMPQSKKSRSETAAERRAMILWPFVDFAEQGEDALIAYLQHVGIDGTMVRYAGDVERAVLAHYRIGTSDHFDIDRAAKHLATWPPIAQRVAELRAEGRR